MLAAPLRIPAVLALALVLLAGAVRAEDLPAPTGEVLLTVSGAVRNTNGDGVAAFDDAMLAALPQVSFTTSTIWTKDRQITFTGPTLAAILAAAGAEGQRIRARAVNDYLVEFEAGEAGPEAPVVARLIDGQPFGIRDNGPLWVVYPYDAAPEYRSELVYARSIWQLVELIVEAE